MVNIQCYVIFSNKEVDQIAGWLMFNYIYISVQNAACNSCRPCEDSFKMTWEKINGGPGIVAHTCNSSTLGGWGRQTTWTQEFETSVDDMEKARFILQYSKL